jgi:hypothetical protein
MDTRKHAALSLWWKPDHTCKIVYKAVNILAVIRGTLNSDCPVAKQRLTKNELCYAAADCEIRMIPWTL